MSLRPGPRWAAPRVLLKTRRGTWQAARERSSQALASAPRSGFGYLTPTSLWNWASSRMIGPTGRAFHTSSQRRFPTTR